MESSGAADGNATGRAELRTEETPARVRLPPEHEHASHSNALLCIRLVHIASAKAHQALLHQVLMKPAWHLLLMQAESLAGSNSASDDRRGSGANAAATADDGGALSIQEQREAQHRAQASCCCCSLP